MSLGYLGAGRAVPSTRVTGHDLLCGGAAARAHSGGVCGGVAGARVDVGLLPSLVYTLPLEGARAKTLAVTLLVRDGALLAALAGRAPVSGMHCHCVLFDGTFPRGSDLRELPELVRAPLPGGGWGGLMRSTVAEFRARPGGWR